MNNILFALAILLISAGGLYAEVRVIVVSITAAKSGDTQSRATIVSDDSAEQKEDVSIAGAAKVLKDATNGSVIWIYMKTTGNTTQELKPLFEAIFDNPHLELRYFRTNVEPIHAEQILESKLHRPIPAGTDQQPTNPDEASDIFLDAYMACHKAEKLGERNSIPEAIQAFKEADKILTSLSTRFPTWNKAIVKFRRERVAEQLQRLESGKEPEPVDP